MFDEQLSIRASISISFGRIIKQKTSNYPRLDYEGYGSLDKKPWTKSLPLNTFWGFWFWLHGVKFSKEAIGRDTERYYLNKDVLVMSSNVTPGDYEFFRADGEFSELYKNDQLDSVLDEYLQQSSENS